MGYAADEVARWKTFEVTDDYQWVLLVTMACIVHYFVCVGIAGSPRGKIFTQDWMEERFGQQHKEALNGSQIQKGGYPDCGSGRYTLEAGYSAWFIFNKAQRVHMNYMEHICQVITMFLTCGLFYPRATWIWGLIYFLGRVMFQVGYSLIGPKGRLIGAIPVMLTQFAFPVFSLVSLFKLGSELNKDAVVVQATTTL